MKLSDILVKGMKKAPQDKGSRIVRHSLTREKASGAFLLAYFKFILA